MTKARTTIIRAIAVLMGYLARSLVQAFLYSLSATARTGSSVAIGASRTFENKRAPKARTPVFVLHGLRLFAIHRDEAPHRCKIRVLLFELRIFLLQCHLLALNRASGIL